MACRHVQIFLKTPTSKDLSLKFYRHLGNLNRSNLQQEKFDKFLKSYFFKKRNRPKIGFFQNFKSFFGTNFIKLFLSNSQFTLYSIILSATSHFHLSLFFKLKARNSLARFQTWANLKIRLGVALKWLFSVDMTKVNARFDIYNIRSFKRSMNMRGQVTLDFLVT